MFTGVACRFVLAVVVVMFGNLAGNSFAAVEANDLALSKALVQVKMFAALTDGEREALKSVATLRRGRVGERIIEEGKALDKMFIILEGQVEVRVKGKPICTFSSQTLVGEVEFLDKLPGSADVVLLADSVLIELNNSALSGLMEKQPRLGHVLMREIAVIEARRLRDSHP